MVTWKDWIGGLFSKERRRAHRHAMLPLVAYYWDGAEPMAHGVLDASIKGIYLLTQQRWYPGTVVTMTLQRAHADASDSQRSITVNAKVVRSGKDGVGFRFLPSQRSYEPGMEKVPMTQADTKTLEEFLERLQADVGQFQ